MRLVISARLDKGDKMLHPSLSANYDESEMPNSALLMNGKQRRMNGLRADSGLGVTLGNKPGPVPGSLH
jgi:hypothetical protein